MDNDSNFKYLLKLISSVIIVLIHTSMFYYTLFYGYNKILAAPLDTGGYLMIALYAAGITAAIICGYWFYN